MQSLILVTINEVMSMQQMAQALGRVVGPMILSALQGSQFGLKWPSPVCMQGVRVASNSQCSLCVDGC